MTDDGIIFKRCPFCKHEWQTREDFLKDPNIKIIGYQVDFEDLKLGLFYFNHAAEMCNTTLALQADLFVDLYEGEVFVERETGSDKCQGLCLYREELGTCSVRCECASIREVIQIISDWEKSEAAE